MSAPAQNVRPRHAINTPCAPASVASVLKASRSPARTRAEIALTGGLSMLTTASAPRRSVKTTVFMQLLEFGPGGAARQRTVIGAVACRRADMSNVDSYTLQLSSG